ncbi:hypothetical protein [Spirosoma utsteinense]|uniref:Uncharacterized protein n=1 Tax=Spirosoma utsteinense TaxID=2585773 RepID=A0ABR6VZU9_9BACT|nr:hypothetical protein [Spirosoma utsteinense]MBC3786501.1 hypothetical protein [Spirosoma utsteinense]MBC3789877.1 hypothetical protein [Spirosoma utsteinense]
MHTTNDQVSLIGVTGRVFGRVNELIEKLLTGPYWQLKVLVYCLVLIVLTTTPFFNLQYFSAANSSWNTLLIQASDLLVPYKGVPGSHDANKVFRLAVPVLIRLFNLTAMQVFISQVVCGLLILRIMVKVSYSALADKASTVFFMTAFVTCYSGYSAFYDVFGRIDAFGYLFILLSVYWRSPVLVFLFCFLTAWSDERGLINTLFTAVYWLYVGATNPRVSISRFIIAVPPINRQVVAVLLSWAGYFCIRWLLSHYYGFQTQTAGVGASQFSISRQFIPLAIFSTYGLVWWLILVTLALIILRRDWLMIALIGAGIIANLGVVMMIADINRSLAYSLPLLVISLYQVGRGLPKAYVRKCLFILSLLSMIVPIYDFDSKLHYHPTFIIRLATLVAGVS